MARTALLIFRLVIALLLALSLPVRPGFTLPVPGEPASGSSSEQSGLAIIFDPGSGGPPLGSVVVEGLSPELMEQLEAAEPSQSEWAGFFRVQTGDRHRDDLPAVLGSYAIDNSLLRFRPQFPFTTGITYHARFDVGALRVTLQSSSPGMPPDATGTDSDAGAVIDADEFINTLFTIPEPDGHPTTRVEAFYPSGNQVPENLLRVYVHFSAPMQARDVHRYVHLFDNSGNEIDLPFVEIDEGLWDPGRRRLTLFFHPGRVKRGVGPNLAMGPPLIRGDSFRLVIDRDFPDSMGYPLAAGFEKTLHVGGADRESPQPDEWSLLSPYSRSDPVSLDFPEPMDHALLQRLLVVEDTSGRQINGQVTVSHSETRWSLTPDEDWHTGEYTVSIHPALEDLAGNTPGHLFEETGAGGGLSGAAREAYRLGFRIE